jgi:hypothetical protein
LNDAADNDMNARGHHAKYGDWRNNQLPLLTRRVRPGWRGGWR